MGDSSLENNITKKPIININNNIAQAVMNNNVNHPVTKDKKKPFTKLKGRIKKFDQFLFDKYDQPARELIKEKLGDKVQDNPDVYAEDLVINDPKCKYKYIELQVCATWLGDNYPHDLPFVYERKGHFSKDTLYIIFDKNMEKGLLFDRESLKKEPSRIKKYSRTFVYEVPWHRILKIYMNDFDMETIYLY